VLIKLKSDYKTYATVDQIYGSHVKMMRDKLLEEVNHGANEPIKSLLMFGCIFEKWFK
jgi:hypothetical protein